MKLRFPEVKKLDSDVYRQGVDYLGGKGDLCLHLLSCYTGESFQHLAQCITYDRTGKVEPLNDYLTRPSRQVYYHNNNQVSGVFVKCSLPEFGTELDFETYCIGESDNRNEYRDLLVNTPSHNNLEIITYSPSQKTILEDVLPGYSHVHHWHVFKYQPSVSKIAVSTNRYKLVGKNDSQSIGTINQQYAVELSPTRSLEFQLAGLPYCTYTIDGSDSYVCIRYYCPLTWIIHYVHQSNQISCSEMVNFITTVGELVKSMNCQLIWRIKSAEQPKYAQLLDKSAFVRITEEHHYHYQQTVN